jgi:6-phosphogluconolactonase (cycloisomerase 2 family)
MFHLRKLGAAAALAVAALAATAGAASASQQNDFFDHGGGGDTVFVQSNYTAGNTVSVYDRASSGALTLAGTYPTGGLGGALGGAAVDYLASENSLVYDQFDNLLFAVNAGSNTVSVFAVRGDQLQLTQQISSGGTFPVSLALRGNVLYVANARNGGSLQGYVVLGEHLFALPGSNRSLGLASVTGSTEFVNTPGQVGFTPDGRQLIVTTKANGSDIDVFRVGLFGELSPTPVVNSEPGAVPFGFTFDAAGHFEVAEAGTNTVATFALSPQGTVTQLASIATTQKATCWIVSDGPTLFASNAGSPSVSSIALNPGTGSLSLLTATTTDPGTVDATVSPDGRFLYVQTGKNGIVDEFQVGPAGALTEIGSVTVPNAVGGEGIAAS